MVTSGGLRVLVTDEIISRFADLLTSGGTDGHTWVLAHDWPAERVVEALPDIDVLVCSRMSPAMARAATRLRLVHVTGAGYDRIPLAELRADVLVANTYHHGRSIAEHVLMSTMMLSRRVLAAERDLRAGRWRTVATGPTVPFGTTLEGRTVGLIGLGEIGSRTAILVSSVGMRVRAVRRDPAGPTPPGVTPDWVGGMADLHLLLSTSDIVVVTVPLTEATRGLIDAEAFAAMRPTAFLINVARGPVVDEQAAFTALRDGVIAGAALDVWWASPRDGTNEKPSRLPFETLDNVLLTPHHSGHTRQTFEGRARDIAANINRLAHGRPLANLVAPRD